MTKIFCLSLTAVFAFSFASCSKSDGVFDELSEYCYHQQLGYVRYAILGDLGEWKDEIEYLVGGASSSTVDEYCQVIFTDVSGLVSQADAVFEAVDSGAFVVVVDPDFDEMVSSLGDYAEELGLSGDAEDEPLMFAFSDNDFFEVKKPISYTGAVVDSLGAVVTPESVGEIDDIDDIDFVDIVNELAAWLDEKDELISTKAEAKTEDKKTPTTPILPSDKQTFHISQSVCYSHQVKHLSGYDDEVWTKGCLNFSADYQLTPMFGFQLDNQGYDYYYVTAQYSNNFGSVLSDLNINTSSSLSTSELEKSTTCVTYNYDNDDHKYTKKDFHGGDIPHNYVFQVKWSYVNLHICGPMQSSFDFCTSIARNPNDVQNHVISFMSDHHPVPKTDIGETTYNYSEEYTFDAGLSIGGSGSGGSSGKTGQISTKEGSGGGDISANFGWGKSETKNYSFKVSDRSIGQIGNDGEAGWRQTFNNLPSQDGEAGFKMLPIKDAARSNGYQEGGWVWQVSNTTKDDTTSVGFLQTNMSVNLRTLCNAYGCSFVEQSWPVYVKMKCSTRIPAPKRVGNGQVTIVNHFPDKATNIKFISKNKNMTYDITCQGTNISAYVNTGKCLRINVPADEYKVVYELRDKSNNVIANKTIENVLVQYSQSLTIPLENN